MNSEREKETVEKSATRGYGKLTAVAGPMFAGKSTELLKRVLWARNGLGKAVLVLKPAFDDRYGTDVVRSHDGLVAEAMPVSSPPDVPEGVSAVFIDEVQFLSRPAFDGELHEFVASLLHRGIDVVCTGLDLDWRGRPFPVTAALLAMADEVVKTTAHCTVCGRDASKSFRTEPDGERIRLGAGDAYQARCNAHWHEEGRRGDAERGWTKPIDAGQRNWIDDTKAAS
jgi:thymidine kinase